MRKSISIAVALAGWLVWGLACGPEPTPPCTEDIECMAGEACKSGKCVASEPPVTVEKTSPEPRTEPRQEPRTEPRVEPRPEPDASPREAPPEPRPSGCAASNPCPISQYCDEASKKCVPRLCGACPPQGTGSCPQGGLCLTPQGGSESFCGWDCSKGQVCPPGFRCFNVGSSGARQCAPSTVSCKNSKVGIGHPCRGANAPSCPLHFPYCSSLDDKKDGVCTQACKAAADCPKGYKRCEDRGDGVKVCAVGCESSSDCDGATPNCVERDGKKRCQADPYTGPEACGRGPGNAKGIGKPCPKGDGDCGGSSYCIGQGRAPVAAFCTADCSSDADCGDGASCRTIDHKGSRKKACLPIDCLCLESPELNGKKDLLAELLKKLGRDRCSLIYEKRELALISNAVAYDPFRLKFFNRGHREPLRFLDWSKASTKALDKALDQPGLSAIPAAIENAAKWLDHPVQATATTYTPDATDPLAQAVATLIKDHGGAPDMAALKQDASDVPAALQKSLAIVILAINDAAKMRNAAFTQEVKASPGYYFDRAPHAVLPGALRFSYGSATKPNVVYEILSKRFGYQKMYQGAWNLADAIARAGLKSDPSYAGFGFNQKTPLGRIILSDNAAHTYAPTDAQYQGDIALLVDTGGDDTYQIQAGANASAHNAVSVLLDLAGADKYGYVVKAHALDKNGKRFPSDDGGRYSAPGYCETKTDCGLGGGPCVNSACQKACKADADCGTGDTCHAGGYCKKLKTATGPISLSNRPRQGGARLGIAFSIDLGSETDEYKSLRMSQGFGALGVGVLYDAGGDETYQCETGCQGAGVFGIGLLIDRSGNDLYRTYSYAQGFGYVRGAGLLLDEKGDDRYLADHGKPTAELLPGRKGDPIYLSAQLPGQANSSFVQGAGFGRRADFSDNLFMSGGLGILRDRAGKDQYVAGVFGQGTGYWYGTGILADQSGDDTYDGFWYVQSATAHFGLSALLEGGGDDKYNTVLKPRATHTGVGHDYSTSFLIDDGGNDVYVGAGLTLGAGNDNGYGFLIDNDGDDKYSAANDNSMGRANSPNPDNNGRNVSKVRTLGIFLDANGIDTYTRPKNASILGDNKLWTQGRSPALSPRRALEHGAGIDGQGSSTLSTQ